MSEVKRYWVPNGTLSDQSGWHQDDHEVVQACAYDAALAREHDLRSSMRVANQNTRLVREREAEVIRERDALITTVTKASEREAALREELEHSKTLVELNRDMNAALQQRLTSTEKQLYDLSAIGRLIATQDNRYTANPMFAVLEKRETITLDTHHHDRIAWVRKNDGEVEADERTHERLELLHEHGRAPKKWDRYAMLEADVFVTACFTEQGCKDYLACNGHNLRMPFIYAFGSYRNAEYNLIRDTLMSIAALKPVERGGS